LTANIHNKKVIEESGHSQVVHYTMKSAPPLPDREVLVKRVWAKVNDDVFVMAVVSRHGHPQKPPSPPNSQELDYTCYVIFERAGLRRTRLLYLAQLNFQAATKASSLSMLLEDLHKASCAAQFFQSFRSIDVYDQEDGMCLGEEYMIFEAGGKKRDFEAKSRSMIESHRGLKELAREHPWYEKMMTKVLTNRLRPAKQISSTVTNVSQKEGAAIGAGFAACLATNLTSDAAVDEWYVRAVSCAKRKEGGVVVYNTD
jgi:hypothetical protein